MICATKSALSSEWKNAPGERCSWDQADGDLQRHGVRHAALLAFLYVVVQLDVDSAAADVARLAPHPDGMAARVADDLMLAKGLDLHHRIALRARPAKMMQTRQPAALALPASDRIVDELERRVLPEVADGKNRLEHRLEPDVVALRLQPVHLQEALVRFLLDLDQVGNRNGRSNLRKVDPFAMDVLREAVHS